MIPINGWTVTLMILIGIQWIVVLGMLVAGPEESPIESKRDLLMGVVPFPLWTIYIMFWMIKRIISNLSRLD